MCFLRRLLLFLNTNQQAETARQITGQWKQSHMRFKVKYRGTVHHTPGYNLYDAGLKKILVPALLDKFRQKQLPGWRRGRKLDNSSFVNKVRLIDLGFVKTLNLGSSRMLHIWTTPSQCCTGTEVITSDNDYSYCLHCNSIQEPQSQLKASLYWPLNKQNKTTVPAPADL